MPRGRLKKLRLRIEAGLPIQVSCPTHLCCWWEYILVQTLWKVGWQKSNKITHAYTLHFYLEVFNLQKNLHTYDYLLVIYCLTFCNTAWPGTTQLSSGSSKILILIKLFILKIYYLIYFLKYGTYQQWILFWYKKEWRCSLCTDIEKFSRYRSIYWSIYRYL